MTEYNSITVLNREIQYSNRMTCELEDNNLSIIIGTKDGSKEFKDNYATSNMQEDYADFEAIAFCAKSVEPKLQVTLRFTPLDWNECPIDFTQENRIKNNGRTISPEYCHYARFLYRAWKMKTLYSWFKIYKGNEIDVDKFGALYDNALNSGKLFLREPDSKSKIKDGSEITENHLEKWFVMNSHKNELNNYFPKEIRDIKLYDQLPCGLFYNLEKNYYEAIHERNRVFNKGYFDIWGKKPNTNDVYLFELKEKKNSKLGIISELFFYSCLLKDFITIINANIIANDNRLKRKRVFYRGFNEFIDSAYQNPKIFACYLVSNFHSFIIKGNRKKNMDSLLKVLNTRNDNVEFKCIWFDQDKIESDFKIEDLTRNWEICSQNLKSCKKPTCFSNSIP